MAKKKKRAEDKGPAGAPDWIVTFADMVSLLVTFFIMLMTFSSLNVNEAFTTRTTMPGTSGVITEATGTDLVKPPSIDLMSAMDSKRGAASPHVRPPEKLVESIVDMGQKLREGQHEVDLTTARDGLIIHYDERAAFAPGSTELSPYLEQALGRLGRMLENYPFMISVEGFTDTEFKPTGLHPTAEALGVARAKAAAEALFAASGLSRKQVKVSGCGSERPIAANDSVMGRRMNRRIEIRVLSVSQARQEIIEQQGATGG